MTKILADRELLPCPFCGGRATEEWGETAEFYGHEHQFVTIECSQCLASLTIDTSCGRDGAVTPGYEFACSCHNDTGAIARERWNRRAQPAQTGDEPKIVAWGSFYEGVMQDFGYNREATEASAKLDFHGCTLTIDPLIRLSDYEALAEELDRQSVITGDYIARAQRMGDENAELRAALAQTDALASEAAQRNEEMHKLLRDIHSGIHCDTLPGNLYRRLEATLFPGDASQQAKP